VNGTSRDAGAGRGVAPLHDGTLEARIAQQVGLVRKILAARATGSPEHAAAIEALARAGLDAHQNRLLTAHLSVSGPDGLPPGAGRRSTA
jgi:hypothetical protein